MSEMNTNTNTNTNTNPNLGIAVFKNIDNTCYMNSVLQLLIHCKPIINFLHFIFVSFKGSLELLKGLGFKTFDGFIDESYDTEADDMKRLHMIIDEIKRISSIPLEELKNKLKDIEDILIYNQIKLLTYDYEFEEIESCKKIINEGIRGNLL